MDKLVLEEMECQFGLMLRDKMNHDNYVLIKFADLDRIINYYDSFKNNSEIGKNTKNQEKDHDLKNSTKNQSINPLEKEFEEFRIEMENLFSRIKKINPKTDDIS